MTKLASVLFKASHTHTHTHTHTHKKTTTTKQKQKNNNKDKTLESLLNVFIYLPDRKYGPYCGTHLKVSYCRKGDISDTN